MKQGLEKMRKQEEGPLIKITYRIISRRITLLVAKTGVTPNQISVASIVIALISGVFFALGTWEYLILAFVFLQLTILFDTIDGDLARYTDNCTEFGRWIDTVANKAHKFFFLLGASIGVFRLMNNEIYLILGCIAIFNWNFSAYISETSKKLFASKKVIPSILKSGKTYFPIDLLAINFLGLSALVNKVSYALWIFSIFSLIVIIVKFYSIYKKWKKEEKKKSIR